MKNFLATLLTIGLFNSASATTIKSLQDNYIPVNKPSDIYIVEAMPVFADTAYRLVIKTEENGTAVMETIHPLDGTIFDIFIKDVDDDGQEELVVSIADDSSGKQQVHFDVYEFENNHLSWVKNFQHVKNLLSLLTSALNI